MEGQCGMRHRGPQRALWPLLLGSGACSAVLLARSAREWLRTRRRQAELELLAASSSLSRGELRKLCILEGFLRRLASVPLLADGLAVCGPQLLRQLVPVAPSAPGGCRLELLAAFPWDGTGAAVEERVRQVLTLRAEDGVAFLPQAGLHCELVAAEDGSSPTVRFRVGATFLGSKEKLLLDVAVCSAPSPGVFSLCYRPLLGPPFRLAALRPEALFAERLQNCIPGEPASEEQSEQRPRDLHDLYLLARSGQLDTAALSRAIRACCCLRGRDFELEELQSGRLGGGCSQEVWRRYRQSTSAPDEVPLQLHEVQGALAAFLSSLLGPAPPTASLPESAPRTEQVGSVVQLPGRADVLRLNCSVHVTEDLTASVRPGSVLRFAGREEQFQVESVGLPRLRDAASPVKCSLQLRQPPQFTARSCSLHLVQEDEAGTCGSSGSSQASRLRRSLGLQELKLSKEEQLILEEAGVSAQQRLARRLDALPPLAPLCYVTSSRRKFEEAQRCLSEFQSMLTMVEDVKPPLTRHLPVEELVRAMALYAFSVLKRACFLDIAYLELDGDESPIFALGTSEETFAAKNKGRKGRLRSFLGFCEDGRHVEVFEGVLEGQVVDPCGAGPLHNTWDRVWLPDDFPGTLAQLESSAFVVSARHLPFLELAQRLRGRDYCQIFEIHVTVVAPDEDTDPVQSFKDACLALKGSFGAVKPVLIQNATGESARQMMTASHHVGSLPEVHVLAFRLSRALVQAGYRIVRTKIEANMSNSGVPISDEEAARLSPENYFEFHLKLNLPPGFDEERLREVAASTGARLSRSALRKSEDGAQKRFVTLRLYGIGRDSALLSFEKCCTEIERAGFAIESKIREYAVYDSNVHLDRGWIDGPSKARSLSAQQQAPSPLLPRTSTACSEGAANVPDPPSLERDTSNWEPKWQPKESRW